MYFNVYCTVMNYVMNYVNCVFLIERADVEVLFKAIFSLK